MKFDDFRDILLLKVWTDEDERSRTIAILIPAQVSLQQNGQTHEIMLLTYCICISLYLLVSAADSFCKQFGPRSGPQNVGPDLDPNYLKL